MAQCIDPYLKGSGLSHFPLGWRRARRKARRCTINPIAKCCQHAASQLNSTRALLLRIRNMDCGLCHQHCCPAARLGSECVGVRSTGVLARVWHVIECVRVTFPRIVQQFPLARFLFGFFFLPFYRA